MIMKQATRVFLIGTAGILFIVMLAYLPYLDITTPQDLSLSYDPNIIAGEGETCLNPYSKIDCAEELECILLEKEPYQHGVCLPEGTQINETIIEKYSNARNESGDFFEKQE